MAEHTKEPWEVRELLPDGVICKRKGTYEIHTPDYDVCATIVDGAPIRNEADAHRIVVCVNACAGINPDAIPGVVKYLRIIANAGINRVQKQRVARAALASLEPAEKVEN